MVNIESTIVKLIKSHNISTKDDINTIASLLVKHIDIICFNIASIANLMSIVSNHTINDNVINDLKKYIVKKCHIRKKVQNGGSMASDFYGYANTRYSVDNSGGTDTSSIQWEHGIARNAIDYQSGGGIKTENIKLNKYITKLIKEIFDRNNVKVSKSYINEIIHIINKHIDSLFSDFKQAQPLTIIKVDKILKMKKYSIFH